MSKPTMDNPDKLKFTKIRSHRINFKYDGVQYSLNEFGDGYESNVTLVRRDDMEDISWNNYDSLNIRDYIGDIASKKNIIYSHIDKEVFLKELACNGFTEKTDEHKQEDKERRIKEIRERIVEHRRDIEILELKLKELEES